MNGTVVIMMVLSGLCFIPSCFPHLYYLFSDGKTWTEAQSYCRFKYTDLATVQNDQQLAELNQLIGSDYYSWIGLHSESETWRWSLENKNYYVGGEADFRMWTAGAPFLNQIYNKVCVLIRTSGKWEDAECSNTLPFICYNGTAGTLNHSLSLIFVNEPKSWTEAQKYCRQHHTDLASVRNQAENDQMKLMIHNQTTWTGLYRDMWKWSDGSSYSVNNWYSGGAPSATATSICVVSYFGKWKNLDCNTKHDFACFLAETRKQVVKMVVEKKDSSVNIEELKEDILQQLMENFKSQGLVGEVKLRWVEQPDGKVFHKRNMKEDMKDSGTFD